MIIQGSNEPIYLIFNDISSMPAGDMSVSLRNEIQEIKRWTLADAVISDGGCEFAFPVTQEESLDWPEGRCVIEAKWLDRDNNTMFIRIREEIVRWDDATILNEVEE